METDRYLDSRREKLLPEIEILKAIIGAVQSGRKQMAELHLLSDGHCQVNQIGQLKWA